MTNECGQAPIVRWRLHAKILETLPEARKIEFVVKYGTLAQLEPEEIVILAMAVRGVDLLTAAQLVNLDSRLGDLEEVLRREQSAGELTLTGKGQHTKIVVICPPPGYVEKVR